MIRDIEEIRFPNGTLSQATCKMDDMGEWSITATIKVDGGEKPDFSEDWVVRYRGAKYVMPLRTPAARKENTSLDSQIDLTFVHWAQRELQRWMFFTVQPVESSTAVPDKYEASVVLTLGDLVILIGQVLEYYYGDTIKIDLNPDWEYSDEPSTIEISYSYIWDVLLKLRELYNVRWAIEPCGDSDHYIIKVGYDTPDCGHVFEYGFEGGLLKVERQVQDTNIRNMLLGRGGEKNLPYRYFKDVDPNNPSFPADPDWIPELRNIYFDRLRGKTFRDYIKGWKTNPRRQLTEKDGTPICPYGSDAPIEIEPFDAEYAKGSYAYMLGASDEKFNPVEYVSDKLVVADLKVIAEAESSIDRYGPFIGGLDDNDDIYPTIQGVSVDPYGRIDQAVDVEQMTTDEIEDEEGEYTVTELHGCQCSPFPSQKGHGMYVVKGYDFDVPDGERGTIAIDKMEFSAMAGANNTEVVTNSVVMGEYYVIATDSEGNDHPATGLPPGKYRYRVEGRFENGYKDVVQIQVAFSGVKLFTSPPLAATHGTFDIWVKNIWQTEKQAGENDVQYAERVWVPILGDAAGEEARIVFTTGWLYTSESYEFKIVKTPVYDTSKKIGDVPSHWRITCARVNADEDAGGFPVPNTMKQGAAGDYFCFLGIDMPHIYALWAEERLDTYKRDQLMETRDVKPTWVVTTDRVRLNNLQEGESETLISRLYPGMAVTLRDERFISGSGEENLYLQSLTITYRAASNSDTALNPDVEMTLGNDYSSSGNVIQQIQGDVSALSKTVMGSLSNIEAAVAALGDSRYIRKDRTDRTPYGLGVKSIKTNNFIAGYKGAQIGQNGNAEVESLYSRSYLKVYELIYNRLNAQEGETMFSDSGTIENITITEGGDINVEMRKRWDGDFTAFQVGDVVYGYVNDLGNATAKEYGKAWAWVKSVDRESNTLTLAKYPDIDVPSGKNMDMTAGMMISRWGNNIAASEQTASDYHFIKQVGDRWVNTRQKSVMISCESGHIAELTGVYKPILEASNFGTVLGQLPEGLLDPETEKYVNLAQPYLYARGVIVQDLIRINYKGEEIRTPRFRGEWDAATAASADDYYRDADSVVDIVTWKGCLWQCVTSHADGDAPDTENGQWMQLTERNYSEWTIEPNVNVVYIRKGTESTDLIMCTVRHHTADGYTDYFTPESLDEFGIELLFSMDGQTYHEFWVRADAVLEADGEGIDLSDGSQLTIGGNNVPWIEVGDNIHLYIRRKSDGEMIDAYTIPVVKDGEDGKQGISIEERFRLYREALANIPVTTDTLKHRNPSGWKTTVPSVSDGNALWMIRARIDGNDNLVDGSWSTPVRVTGLRGADGKDGVGKTGLMAYPAGEFDPDVTYESTEKTTPVVMDGRDGDGVGQYFVLMPDRVYNASYMTYKTPHEDAANNGGNWERMDRFNSIFADIIMAEFAKLASAVFSGDLMFSQQGVDKDGNFSTQYQLINKIEGGKQAFTPNLLLDFLSGDAHAKRFMAGNTIFSGDMRYGVLDNFGQGMMRGEILSPSGMGEASGTTIEETIVLSEITIGQPTQLHLEVQMYGQTSDAMFSGGNQYLRPRCSVELYNTLTAKSVDGTSGALSILNANNERTENYYKTITLPVGSYQFRLKMRYELGDAPTSVSGTKRDYARFGWKGVTVMTQNDAAYQSIRYGNGEIIGDSPANYFMTYQDEEGNMVMQMQTKKGYGIKVGPNGVQVMAAEYSGWESLESYIRGVMKQ